MKNITVFLFFTFFSLQSFSVETGILSEQKKALKIAEAYFILFYGEKVLEQRPFKGTDKGEYWEFSGTLPKGLFKGGVATIELKKKDGAVINIYHEK